MGARIALIIGRNEHSGYLRDTLRKSQYEIVEFSHSPRVGQDVRASAPDLVIYECDGPDRFDETALTSISDAVDVPILAIGENHNESLVVGVLRSGADGCLCQPFKPSELLAHIDAHLRRHWRWGNSARHLADDELIVDPLSCTVVVGRRVVKLTPTEYRLLTRLAQENGQVVTRDELCTHVWGTQDKDVSPNTVSLYISHLRKKLEPDPRNPQRIRTKWGIGYYLSWNVRKV